MPSDLVAGAAPPSHCFICERPETEWKPPYVDLGLDGIGRKARAHFVCWQNARSPIVAGGVVHAHASTAPDACDDLCMIPEPEERP